MFRDKVVKLVHGLVSSFFGECKANLSVHYFAKDGSKPTCTMLISAIGHTPFQLLVHLLTNYFLDLIVAPACHAAKHLPPCPPSL